MPFRSRKNSPGKQTPKGDRGRVQKAKKTVKRSRPVAMEVKILAVKALDSGLPRKSKPIGSDPDLIALSKEAQTSPLVWPVPGPAKTRANRHVGVRWVGERIHRNTPRKGLVAAGGGYWDRWPTTPVHQNGSSPDVPSPFSATTR